MCRSRVIRRLGTAGMLAAAFAALFGGMARAEGWGYSVFAGILTDNSWEQVVFTPWRTRFEKPGFVGLSLDRQIGSGWHSALGHVQFGIEAQVVRQFGLQRHWEVNLPVTLRLTPERSILWLADSFAFGFGPSHATRPPALERRRGGGDVLRNQIYWHGELARDLPGAAGNRAFLRLHHRSDGYGLMGQGGSSNGLVLGLRIAR